MRSHAYIAAIACALTGCGSAEPRGEQYFSAHIEKAKQVVADCAAGTVRGDECYNAEVAVSKAKAKERAKKFFGDGKAYDYSK